MKRELSASPDVLGCPWCGGPPILVESWAGAYLECGNHSGCPVQPRTLWCESEEKSVEVWNSRKTSSAPRRQAGGEP